MFKEIKENIVELLKSRIFVLTLVFFMLFSILIAQCFQLQIINGEKYQEQYTMLIQKTKEVQGTRGNIYDKNGVLLAYNELAYAVSIEDNGDYSSVEEKNLLLNETITSVISIVESHDDSIINTFKIILNNEGDYEFLNDPGTTRMRFIADIYGEAYIDSLTEEQSNASPLEIITYLCTDSKYGYGIEMGDSIKEKEHILKLINIRYAMSLNGYRKYLGTTIAEDVSAKTVAAIMENSNILQGVTIEENSLRRYVDSEYFAPILGYTGSISQDEYDVLIEEGFDHYTLTDMVGKSGIEKEMETILQGTKGEEKVYVNSVGKVIDTVSTTQATVGNDVYLTIDSELQKIAYDLLEEKLAGIILAKLTPDLKIIDSDELNSETVTIPIGNVYKNFFANSILDFSHFANEEASSMEKSIYESYKNEYDKITTKVLAYLKNENGAIRNDIDNDFGDFVTHVTAYILKNNSEIIMNSKVDTEDDLYKQWANEGTINAYTYLNHAIAKNWIDTAKLQKSLGSSELYSDSTEIFEAMLEYVEQTLKTDKNYKILIYSNMIETGKITGRQICLLAFEQDVFPYTESEKTGINNGSISAYDYIYQKIKKLELTPGQLGLEPCSGSVVITDPNNGDVLALVSYPGYDNNRLTNTIDSAYYSKLATDLSSPFYNHATQEKTAPGSTFKMITLAAGITENVITNGSVLYCSGTYEKVTPNPKCWIHPYSHGYENPSSALQNSCNNYFYEVGYRLSLKDRALIGTDDKLGSTTLESYSSNLGTDSLAKYAAMFGLDEKTGIEIPEASPEISNQASVPSAIGQGTHNFTTSQLARYIATVANKGNVYDLTLIDRAEDMDHNIIDEFKVEQREPISEISDTTWNTIHKGMELMVQNSGTFKSLDNDITIAGKTGTAQQSKKKPNHALFVGFTPVKTPEIAFAVRIANGYNSAYAAEIGRDISSYYGGSVNRKDIIKGSAANLGSVIAGD